MTSPKPRNSSSHQKNIPTHAQWNCLTTTSLNHAAKAAEDVATMKQKQASLVIAVLLFSIVCILATPCTAEDLATLPTSPRDEQKERRLKKTGTKESDKDAPVKKLHSKRESKKDGKNDKFDGKKESKKDVKNKEFDDKNEFQKDVKNKKVGGKKQGVQMAALYYGKGRYNTKLSFGAHYVDLWCGTPPQRQTVLVDTGSSVTAFPCSGCTECGAGTYHIDNAFEERNSSTFSVRSCDHCDKGERCSKDGQCIIEEKYTKESFWSAFKARDRCYLGGPHNAPLSPKNGTESIESTDPNHAKALMSELDFGCQTNVSGFYKTQLADGVLGMGDFNRSFWSQLYKAGKGGSSNQFSLCFSRPVQHNRTGTVAGAITLGGSDTRLHQTPMVFSKRANKTGYYEVYIRKIYLRSGQGGGSARSSDPDAKVISLDIEETKLNEGGVIIDSGTASARFSKRISSEFRAVFKEIARGTDFSTEQWALEEGHLAIFPTILVQLKGDKSINKQLHSDPTQVVGLAGDLDPDHPYDVIIAIPPSHYMELGRDGHYTPRIDDMQPQGNVLGGSVIMGHDVLFDMDRQVIGWAESTCDYNNLVRDNGYRDVLEGPIYREVPDYDSESDDEDDDDDDDSVSNSGYDRAFGSVSMTPELEAAIYKLDAELNLRSRTKTITAQNASYDPGFLCYRLDVIMVLVALLIFERFCIGRYFCRSSSSATSFKKITADSHSGLPDDLSSDDDDEGVPFVRRRNH